MRFFKLLFLLPLSAIILTGCERQITSPIINTAEHKETDTQFVQNALLDLADTAAAQGFINLAEAGNEFVEALATEDQTSVQPTFSKLARFASEVTYLESSFANAGCSIELRAFAEASVDTIRAYTIRDAAEMGRALQNLAQEAETASMALQQLSVLNNSFRPFVFGHSSRYVPRDCSNDVPLLGILALEYEKLEAGINETEAAVIDFLASKGYKAMRTYEHGLGRGDSHIYLGAQVNTKFIIEEFGAELRNIPNVMYIAPALIICDPKPLEVEVQLPSVYELNRLITNSISYRYNKAWCQGNLDVNTIDSILIGISGLDFFNYAFLQNLVDIYVEEKPEITELIRSNMFSFRSIVLTFLNIYFVNSGKTPDELIKMYPQYFKMYPQPPMENNISLPDPSEPKPEKIEKTLNETIESFRQSVRDSHVYIHRIVGEEAPGSYYYWHWK